MAITASNVNFLLLLLSFQCGRFEPKQTIKLGASLSSIVRPTSWPSPSGRFAFGFYKQGNGFKVGILLLDGINETIVWTANRDDPPVSSNARLVLTMRGVLLLQTGLEQNKVIAHIKNNGIVSSASMLDYGNFVLQNKNSDIIWQSFDHPTDTVLGGQILPSGGQLVSSSSDTNKSSGRFQLSMQADGNLVLYPRYSDGTIWDVYWASGRYQYAGFKYYLFLNRTDPLPLYIVNASHSVILWRMDDIGYFKRNNTIYRATIDSDGILQLYAHFDDTNRKHQVVKLWSTPKLDNLCKVKTFCGCNSYCTINDNQPYCNCLPGTDYIDPNHKNLGCKRNFSEAECEGGKDNVTFYYMSPMSNMNMDDLPYAVEEILKEECSSSCLQDCYCGAAFYKGNRCKKLKLPFRYVRRETQGSFYTIYFKVGNVSLKSNNTPSIKKTSEKAILLIILLILGFAIFLRTVVAISSRFIYNIGVLSYKRLLEIGDWRFGLERWDYSEYFRAMSRKKQRMASNKSWVRVPSDQFIGDVYRKGEDLLQ